MGAPGGRLGAVWAHYGTPSRAVANRPCRRATFQPCSTGEPVTTDPNSEGWQFVVDHWETIRRYCCYLKRDYPRIDIEDLIQDVALDLLTSHRLYDPAKGKPRNLIYMRVRKAKQMYLERQSREPQTNLVDLDNLTAAPVNLDRLVLLSECLSAANQKEADAIASYLHGETGAEVKRSIGCTAQARSVRVRKLAMRLQLRS